MAAALCVVAFLAAFLIVPVATVFHSAFVNADGSFTAGHFVAFFNQPLMKEAFYNSLYVAVWSTAIATLLAVPLAYFTVRFKFRGALLIQTLGILPLIMPPFVGAVAMQLIFGRSGSVNLLLGDWFDINIPLMEGLNSVIFVESLHYFPFILMNLVVALRNIDGAMEEAAFNLGSRGFRLFRRVIFPLALPGYVAGASLVFVKVFDDLGTPLVLGTTNMLAPQAYLRITQVGLEDPLGYVISVIIIAFSIASLWLSARVLKGKDYSTLQKGGAGIRKRSLRRGGAGLRLDHPCAAARPVTTYRRAAVVVCQRLEFRAPAGRLHAGALRYRVPGLARHDREYAALLRPCGRRRRGAWHRHCLPDAAHAPAGAAMAGLDGLGGAGGARHCAGHRPVAHLPQS
jgi:iron(III) transport system permease protein